MLYRVLPEQKDPKHNTFRNPVLLCGELMSTRRPVGVEAKPGALRRSPPDTEKQHDENGGKRTKTDENVSSRFIFIHVVVVSSVLFVQGVDMFSVFSWSA